jgi:hypothetical protein
MVKQLVGDSSGDERGGLLGLKPTTVLVWLALVAVGASLYYVPPMVTGLVASLG